MYKKHFSTLFVWNTVRWLHVGILQRRNFATQHPIAQFKVSAHSAENALPTDTKTSFSKKCGESPIYAEPVTFMMAGW